MGDARSPKLELVAERPALIAAQMQTVTVLVRVVPPEPSSAAKRERPSLNLGLVLDRSGSMNGPKMEAARRAASYCVDQLRSRDRVSIVVFDDEVATIASGASAGEKAALKAAIGRIDTGGSTALHGGWAQGVREVGDGLLPNGINRVLLLTDGQANIGETRVRPLCLGAASAAQRGVTTSTIGIGSDFNEELLVPMAEAGRGNAHHVAEIAELARIFEIELGGLVSQFGERVSLGIEPAEGAEIVEMLNDLPSTTTGRAMLPNLAYGAPIAVVVRVRVRGGEVGASQPLLRARLAWDESGDTSNERHVVRGRLQMRCTAPEALAKEPLDARVLKASELLLAARARRRAIEHLDRGDVRGAREIITAALDRAQRALAILDDDGEVRAELDALERLRSELASRFDVALTRKRMRYESYEAARSRRHS